MKKLGFLIFLSILLNFSLFSESITYSGSKSYKLTERTDLRRYENGKYVGLTTREVHSFISGNADALNYVGADSPYRTDSWYDGNFFVTEETLRNNKNTAPDIYEAIPSVFRMSPDGTLTMYTDNGYPSFRSFPVYPKGNFTVGQKWTGQGERAVDPLYKGIVTRIPILVEYTYVGTESYNGEDVFRLKAQWATRYDRYRADPKGDKELYGASGKHNAFILVSCETGAAVLVKDQVDETYSYADGTNIQLKGTITLFTEYPPQLERKNIIPALNRIASSKGSTSSSAGGGEIKSGGAAVKEKLTTDSMKNKFSPETNNMIIEDTFAGIRLSVRAINFYPDSNIVLDSEKPRLDEIASVLKLAPNSQFLVEGHTASAGKPAVEYSLSIMRAKAFAEEMVARGIPADRFICNGFGSNKPVADNMTEEGRSQNRRVEITILE